MSSEVLERLLQTDQDVFDAEGIFRATTVLGFTFVRFPVTPIESEEHVTLSVRPSLLTAVQFLLISVVSAPYLVVEFVRIGGADQLVVSMGVVPALVFAPSEDLPAFVTATSSSNQSIELGVISTSNQRVEVRAGFLARRPVARLEEG